jgi:L-iditol 2-dehydrogenase/threonine 3-dehydrogenase
MRQATMVKPGLIEFQEAEKPGRLNPHEILLEIKRIGVCGSDIHVWHGLHPFTSYPIIQGHEYSGEVAAVGDNVTKVKPGDKATARPQLVCGTCGPCKRGDYNVCKHLKVQGFQANGSARDFFVVPEERLVKIPDRMSFEMGALIEPVAVGAHSTSRPGRLEGENVVVFGAGTIGNIVAQYIQARGAARVMISDYSEFRLAKARECGIEFTSNPAEESFKDALARVFGDDGFNVAFEAAGAESPIVNAVENIENGGDIIILGVFDKPAGIHMSFVCERELRIIGSMMYKHEDYCEAVEFMDKGLINVDPLVTKEFAFEEYNEAYRYIDEFGDKSMKVMINMEA